MTRLRRAVLWVLQSVLATTILLLLWQPALSVATLRPQQNIVAVLIDDSRSMSLVEDGVSRREQAIRVLDSGLLEALKQKFQVRLYRAGDRLNRIDKLDGLHADLPATRIGDSLRAVVDEAASLPIGAVVLLSDGADNSGGIDMETTSEVRRRRIPVHAVGFGREQFARDIEVTEVDAPARTLTDSRVTAQVTLRQRGYTGQKARVTVRENNKTLAVTEVKLKADGASQTETVTFHAGLAGARNVQVSVDAMAGEENQNNNALTRLINVESYKPRVLYFEGEPKWDFKFIRRAVEDDRSLRLVTMLRPTQNKIYRQGVDNQKELEQGFPAKVEELFGFEGLVFGSVDASYFTTAQQELIRQFVDRRGGGILFLAGRSGLADGGWGRSALANILPVVLPERKGTFVRERAQVQLTPPGVDHLITRLEEEPGKNIERWKKLPPLADYQDVGVPKPGAVTLAEAIPGARGALPLLVAQNYGRGRTAVFATSGSWRWQMLQDHTDRSHEMFWQQLLRWLVADTRGHVVASTPRPVLADDPKLPLRVEVRDRNYLPATDARAEARIQGPDGIAETVELTPDPVEAGVYTGLWHASKAGAYVAEVAATRGNETIGHDVLLFRREDGVAENFRQEQNREALEKLASETGGGYYRPQDAAKLAQEVSYSEAGITTREIRDLWNMPAVFLLLLLLKGSEWLLRRKWGAV
jgi:uncharacterized membrane protein